MVHTSLQTWIYAEFVFSSYLYIVYYICNFNALIQNTVHIVLCAIRKVVVKRSIIQ